MSLTAEIVFYEPAVRNEVVFLAGDTVTYGEIADKLEAALDRPFSRYEWSAPFLMEELANDPQSMMCKYRAAFAQGRGVAWDKAGTFNERHGIPVLRYLPGSARTCRPSSTARCSHHFLAETVIGTAQAVSIGNP